MVFFRFGEVTFPTFVLVMLLFASCGLLCHAQEQKYYLHYPNNAAEPAGFRRQNAIERQSMNTAFKYGAYGSKAYLKKASRLFSRQVVQEQVASSTLSMVDKWEHRIKILSMLDLEAEEYKNQRVLIATNSLRLFK